MGQRRSRAAAGRRAATASSINALGHDPGSGVQPIGGPVLQRPEPKLSAAPFAMAIENPRVAPPAQFFPSDTAEFRYWVAAEAARRGADYWGQFVPNLAWSVPTAKLPIDLDRGVDLNAFYDRIGLRFYHALVGGRTVFSGESPDVVCHELGHAVLDAIKPQLWDAASIEVAAFHEAFGDLSAILSALQLESMRHTVLNETGGMLFRSSSLSRVAEQLGWAIRQGRPVAVDVDCLRNAVNSFFYADPNTLPTLAPASTLSSQSHSFSRVFTAGCFEGLAGMFRARPAQDETNLLQVSVDMGRILVDAIQAASVVPTFFSQVAANMLTVADNQFPNSGYREALNSGFVRHGIIPPTFSMALVPPPVVVAAAGAGAAKELPKQNLSVVEYGLGIGSIVVFAADEPKRFDVAGAAMAVGAVAPTASNDAAKSFVEDLMRRGRIRITPVADRRAEITRAAAPATHDTFTHELRQENGEVVLRRVRIDCGFHT